MNSNFGNCASGRWKNTAERDLFRTFKMEENINIFLKRNEDD